MSYKETKEVDEKKGKTTYTVTDEKAREVDEVSPRLNCDLTLSLGNFTFLKVGSHRSGESREQVAADVLADMVVLKNEFKRRHEELFD